jgi:ATP-independent RNA helicase DbpA
LAGKDLIAQAKTGSGKTAAFALSLLTNLNPRRFAVQALVLCPRAN